MLFQIGAGKGAPVAFGDENVTGLETGGRSDLRGDSRYRLVAHVKGLIRRNLEELTEVDVNIDDGRAVAAERFGEPSGVFHNLRGGMRRGIHSDNGVLQINYDKCCLSRIESKFCHGFL